jgi:hypothetical protein
VASSSTYDALTREHPAYRAGWNDGRDTGLVIAMNIITMERGRLHQVLTTGSPSQRPLDASRISYAEGRLYAVARILAAMFRSTN